MSVSKVRIGVVGAGLIGRKHIAVLNAGHRGFELAGIAEPAPQMSPEDLVGVDGRSALCVADVDTLIRETQPDGIVIAVPNQMHVDVGLRCVAAGLPMLIEKPVAATVGEALQLVEAAEAAGVATLTGHHRRHNPIMLQARELVDRGAMGRVVTANALWLTHKPVGYHDVVWRREPGGGPVLINAIHDIDCLRMLLGDVAMVHAMASNAVREFAVEDTAAAVLQFESGVIGTLLVSDAVSSPWSWETTSGENPAFANSRRDAITIAGTRGALAIPSLELYWHEPGQANWQAPLTMRRERVIPVDPYVPQMENFAAVIRGEARPRIDGRDGTMTLATTLAITKSAATGEPVHVAHMLADRR